MLSVLLFHTGVIRGGYLGVDVFFALSGFLITRLLIEEQAATGAIALRAFYVRRGLRLLPALFAFLGIWGIYLVATVPPDLWSLVGAYVAVVILYAANWAEIWWYRLGIFGHTWSLAIEEQFYLIWPLAVFLLLRGAARPRRIAWILLAGAAASVLWRVDLALESATEARIYLATDTHSDGLLVGAAVAFLLNQDLFNRFPKPLGAMGFLSAIGLAAMLVAVPFDPYYACGVTALAALATGVIILSALARPSVITRLLDTRALVGTGMISYALYLWHFPIFHTLGVLKEPGRPGPWASVVLAWGLTFAAAVGSYFLIERPALAWKDRFTWRRRQTRAGAIRRSPQRPAEIPVDALGLDRGGHAG